MQNETVFVYAGKNVSFTEACHFQHLYKYNSFESALFFSWTMLTWPK